MKMLMKMRRIGSVSFIFLVLSSVMTLTGCTGRNEVVLRMEETESEEAQDAVPEDQGTEETFGPENAAETGGAVEGAVPDDIYVHICGAVTEPGVYVLPSGSRVYEGIEAAGGFREDACEDFINQAGMLSDGQRLVIPTEEEVMEAEKSGAYPGRLQPEESGPPETGMSVQADSPAERVNINTATEKELSGITGIGAGKAAAIVKYRQENGGFASIEDIMKVSGIKEGTFEKIKDRITVN